MPEAQPRSEGHAGRDLRLPHRGAPGGGREAEGRVLRTSKGKTVDYALHLFDGVLQRLHFLDQVVLIGFN